MNREILFRGKSAYSNKWLYGNLIDNGLSGKDKSVFILPTDADNYDEYEEVIPETVGQFTGLKDKNGIRIFEGD